MTCEVALTCFLCWQEDCPLSPKQNSGLEVGSAPGSGPCATCGGPVAEGAAGRETNPSFVFNHSEPGLAFTPPSRCYPGLDAALPESQGWLRWP